MAIVIVAVGCATTPKQYDPFLVNDTKSEAMAEGSLRGTLRQVDRIKRIDPRFAVHIPYFHLTNAPLDVALNELNIAWKKELGTKELPVVIKIGYSSTNEPPYDITSDMQKNITFTAYDPTVAELLFIIAEISRYEIKIIANTLTLEYSWLDEGWCTGIIPMSPAGRQFFGITDSTTSVLLTECLSLYGITFPDGSGFYAKWSPEIEQLIIFNYPEQIDRLEAILMLIDEGFEIKTKPNK